MMLRQRSRVRLAVQRGETAENCFVGWSVLKKVSKKSFKNLNSAANSFATNPIAQELIPVQNAFTRKAVELYEKQADIKKYTELVLQDDITEEFLNNTQAELLLKDVFNPFADESYKKLAQNEKLLKDLAADIDNCG